MTSDERAQPSFLRRLLVHPFAIRPTAKSLGAFYRQFAALLRAGIPVLRALDSVEEQCASRTIRRRLPEMRRHIEDGGDVAGAFALFEHILGPVDVAMIGAAERGGRLTEVLEILSAICKRRARLMSTFIAGVIYPALVLHLAVFVIPIVHSAQDPEMSYWGAVLPNLCLLYGALAAVFIVPRVLRQFPSSAYALDAFKEFVPVYSGASEKLAIARLARATDGLYNSGVSLGEALPVAAGACGNELLRRKVERLVPLVTGGEPLSAAMKTVGGFPVAFVNMIATGEESGQLSQMLTNAAEYYETEAETALTRIVVVLPVVIYLVVAAYVGYQIIQTWSGLITRSTGLLPKDLAP